MLCEKNAHFVFGNRVEFLWHAMLCGGHMRNGNYVSRVAKSFFQSKLYSCERRGFFFAARQVASHHHSPQLWTQQKDKIKNLYERNPNLKSVNFNDNNLAFLKI